MLSREVIANQERPDGRVHQISLDQALALSRVFDVSLDTLLNVACDTCANTPPPGFSCTTCGLAA
jgi:hypothetical protein